MILPYANASAEQLIQAGQTDLGISYPPDVIINNADAGSPTGPSPRS